MLCVLKGGLDMRKTLEDLYYGNIRPYESKISAGSELQRMTQRVDKCEARLSERLDESDRHTLEALTSAYQEINSINAVENFIIGFRLGPRLIIACMDDSDGNIQEVR
jgi:hypothetical protein